MSATNIDIDDEVLERVMRTMGVRTKREAVNTALTEYLARAERGQAFDDLLELGRDGAFEPTREQWRARKRAQGHSDDGKVDAE